MCRSNGVKVARKVQVYLLHGQHLGISSTSGTAFHAETRTQRGFAQSDNCLFAYLVQSECQTDGYGCFTDTRLCRSNCRHQYQITFLHLLFINQMSGNLGYVSSIVLYLITWDIHTFGNLLYLLQLYAAGYFNVRFHTESFL